MVAVVIPVTNKAYYLEHIQECLESIVNQTRKPQVIIVEDGPCPIFTVPSTLHYKRVFVPARVGVASAFNIGIAKAFSMGEDRVLMMGCDDVLAHVYAIEILTKTCIQEGYHWLDTTTTLGEIENWPTGHALVTRKFWEEIGGYPIEAPLGCDSVLLNLIPPEMLHYVDVPVPLIHVRRNELTYTGSRDPRWLDIIFATRALLKEIKDGNL